MNADSLTPAKGKFRDRREAGQLLAERLQEMGLEHPVVLCLPRGGVPVGLEIALALRCPLDVLLVRKLGAPDFPELGLGAVVEGDPPLRVLNDTVVEAVAPPMGYLEREEQRQLAVIAQRRAAWRGDQPPVDLVGHEVIVADDGLATGGTMRAALLALAQRTLRRVVVAVPVAPQGIESALQIKPVDFVCLLRPEPFHSVGLHYDDFEQVDDDDVTRWLQFAATATRHHDGP